MAPRNKMAALKALAEANANAAAGEIGTQDNRALVFKPRLPKPSMPDPSVPFMPRMLKKMNNL